MYTESYCGLAHQTSRMRYLFSLQSSVCEEESIIELMLLEIKCHGLFSGRKKRTHLARSRLSLIHTVKDTPYQWISSQIISTLFALINSFSSNRHLVNE